MFHGNMATELAAFFDMKKLHHTGQHDGSASQVPEARARSPGHGKIPCRIRLCPITGQFFVKPTVLYGGVSNQEEDYVASLECLKKWHFSKHNESQ